MDIFEAIRLRRSVRAFTEENVSDEDVMKLIDAARRAPSAGNIQPWEFIIVRKPDVKRQIAEAALNQSFIEEAPVVVVVCADENRSGRSYGSRGINLYCIQDTAAATENLLLAATALGLGACWVGAFHENAVKNALNLPRGIRPVAIIPVGHASEKPRPSSKRVLEDIIHHETF
ncbi:MAG: nitroreductase family protein [Candidatus Bathyarchaeia archaeon]